MKINIEVENIRCGGCTNTITKKLMTLEGVESVDIAIDEQIVTVHAKNNLHQTDYIAALLAMGYPEKGSVEGINALKGKAKSVISCAIGKIS